MEKAIVKKDAFETIRSQARMYISSPERAAEALLFVRQIETLVEEVKKKVKDRAMEIMDEKQQDTISYSITDPETGEIREWEVRRAYGSVTKEYRPDNVLAALGVDAAEFLSVKKTALDRYLKKASAKKMISMKQVELCVKDPIEKFRKGAGVILREIKATLAN